MFGFFGVIVALLRSGLTEHTMMIIAFLYLAALFGICFIILRQNNMNRKPSAEHPRSAEERLAELRPLTTAQLNEWHEPAVGVTENTTRTLDEMRIPRK